MLKLLGKIFGTANDRIIKKLRKEVAVINNLETEISQLSDEALRQKTDEFKAALNSGKKLDDICYEAFAVVREASKRVLGMRHFDVQLMGGLILHRGMITEMRTGEGKTLVATLPAYLNALTGKGVHVVTVNDYLAQRDSEWKGKLYNFLGLSTGYIISGQSDEERQKIYQSDIIYATNNELGFDYLKDNMKFTVESKVQRPFNYAIIDEVDSILIDEARTPLIISGPVDDNSDLYNKINLLIKQVKAEHYEKDEKAKSVNLNEEGMNFVESLLEKAQIIALGTSLYDVENMSLVHHVTQALKAHMLFAKDVDYIVQNDKVQIIDEFTGRIMDGRRFSEGLHQALEAKEGVKVQNENQTLASITFQNYFRMYPKLSGMTGTALTEAAEFKDIYSLDVVAVPTHHPVQRIDYEDEIYGTLNEKYDAIVKEVKAKHEKGQPILVGTVSIEKSETISELLTKHKIAHTVLNAKQHEREAHIIAQAGRYKAVTIATNMAGRGTDIMLGGNPEMQLEEAGFKDYNSPKAQAKLVEIKAKIAEEKQQVIEAGGLYVIGTERHESRRIDNQLRGRSGRQGDPGATKFYLSLEDDLMRIFASDRVSAMLRKIGLKGGEAIHSPMISASLEKAQNKVEGHNYEIRKTLLRFDDVMNDQRKVIYEQRHDIITSEDLSDVLYAMSEDLLRDMFDIHIPPGSLREDWDFEGLKQELVKVFAVQFDDKEIASLEKSEQEFFDLLWKYVQDAYQYKYDMYGKGVFNNALRYVLINTLDQMWKDHLLSLDHLRQGINLRAYGQKNPLNEYKIEAFKLFEKMLESMRFAFVQRVAHLQIDMDHLNQDKLLLKNKELQQMDTSREDPAFKKYNSGHAVSVGIKPINRYVDPEDRDPDNPETWGKVARNETCPCRSGRKYKYCHGSL